MQKSFKAHLTGIAPLIMHNGQGADPLNRFSKAMKQISSKRHKTDADFEEMAKIEWHAGLYLLDGRPCIPGMVLDSALVSAARKMKRGQQASAGLYAAGDFLLIYEGPADVAALWEEEQFRIVAPVRVQRNKIIRTRPRFNNWEADVEICFNDEQLNASDVREFLVIAGRDLGLMDWRPRHGRFAVE